MEDEIIRGRILTRKTMFRDAGFLKALRKSVRETEAAVRLWRIRERCILMDLSHGNKTPGTL